MKYIFSLLALTAAAASGMAQQGPVTLHVGDPAPPLSIVKWAKGQPVAELGHGKVNVVEFWATWCPPCRESIPHLTELAKKYRNANFIGVDSFEHEPDATKCYTKVEKFVSDMGDKMDYHIAIDGVDGTMGKTGMEAAGQGGIPTAFVVGPDGKIDWIGHPMNLESVLPKVLDGSFDAKAEAEKQRLAEDRAQRSQAEAAKAIAKWVKPIMDARTAKDYRGEVAAIDKGMDELAQVKPDSKPSLQIERLAALSQYDQAGAEKYAQQLADESAGNPMMQNEIAWTIVMEKSPIKHLNPMVALKIAKAAAVGSHYDPSISDTLALAFYRAGMPSDALATQKVAVAKAKADKGTDANTLTEMEGRLKTYEQAAIKPAH